ncbi:hypothetical protein VTL71DRAFT_14487 [Oculimacula yallundae]|uniref:Uncharacterized protein n=1 Tax=Oculimacula yallundae TaxID=86028 RepID=A0ABR4CIR8_9HELO
MNTTTTTPPSPSPTSPVPTYAAPPTTSRGTVDRRVYIIVPAVALGLAVPVGVFYFLRWRKEKKRRERVRRAGGFGVQGKERNSGRKAGEGGRMAAFLNCFKGIRLRCLDLIPCARGLFAKSLFSGGPIWRPGSRKMTQEVHGEHLVRQSYKRVSETNGMEETNRGAKTFEESPICAG